MVDTNINANTTFYAMQTLSLNIFGEPASKANSRRMVYIKGKPMFIKSQKALDYAKSFKQQCQVPPLLKFLSEDVSVTIRIWYASRRPDLDESLILDLLQDVAYVNDRQVKEKHIYWALDRENPRCEIDVAPLQQTK
jgi:Holliday junction resolvase RusA-like endonuclease